MATADLQNITEKFSLAEDDFKEEDINVFLVNCQKCLEEEEATFVLKIIQDTKNQTIINNMGWNLIGPITKCIVSSTCKEKRKIYMDMLDQLIMLCNPKEVLLGVLEQIDEAAGEQISQVVLLLLQPLQTVLMNLGNKKAYSVGLSLSTIYSRISLLPVPYTNEQMEEDKHGLCQCCFSLVQFTKHFIDLSQNTELKGPDNAELREELINFCFSCLKYPLLCAPLNLNPDDKDSHPFQLFAREILGMFVSLGEPLPGVFLQHGSTTRTPESNSALFEGETRTAEAFACLAYLLFVQHIGLDHFPFVFGPTFLVKTNMQHVNTLLKRTEESVLLKGLELLESSLLRVENECLHQDLLEIGSVLCVLQDLVKVMTLCPIEHLGRKCSMASISLNLIHCNKNCCCALFRCLFKTCNHAGVEGYIIQSIKNQIDTAFKTKAISKWFSGPRLTPLLHMVLSLPEGAETDLLQYSDRIMASLNLLRYLIIKDNETENKTGVWTEVQQIEKDFLKPLHMGLNMSKAHYQAEIKSTHEKKKGPPSKMPICSVSAGGNKLPDMTPEMQLQVLRSALFTFDLMESVLARVDELVEVKMKSASEEKIGSSQDV
ncbi:hypothetical protein GDO86_007713 [Hymenochirus boettgeri]|uniref:Glomulin n=1 Tax=Hymenochirus boettgeri TaxID=247094 RepID=A0A8T2IUW0_9PIPI|nr:hypothetical protein GDO86_007713 [Hymenochirus boettgeri]